MSEEMVTVCHFETCAMAHKCPSLYKSNKNNEGCFPNKFFNITGLINLNPKLATPIR